MLNPLTVTPIMPQASGVVQAVYCNRGTKVAKNQLCAKLDPRPFEDVIEREKGALAAAETRRAEAETRLAAAQADFDRKTAQFRRRAIRRKALNASQRALERAGARVAELESALTARREALANAEASLNKTNILVPSAGIVIARNVEPGTTISAGAEQPLFLVATDLTKVQLEVQIGEKGGAEIKVGDGAVITVATLPGKSFSGVVGSLRRAEAPSENGVIYSATIDAENPDLLLEPGMTATVSIEVYGREASAR